MLFGRFSFFYPRTWIILMINFCDFEQKLNALILSKVFVKYFNEKKTHSLLQHFLLRKVTMTWIVLKSQKTKQSVCLLNFLCGVQIISQDCQSFWSKWKDDTNYVFKCPRVTLWDKKFWIVKSFYLLFHRLKYESKFRKTGGSASFASYIHSN